MSRQYNHRLDASRAGLMRESDTLGRTGLARAIASELMEDSESSKIVGVYGSWGSGKSFLLDKVIDELFSNKEHWPADPIVTVFEAWRFEMEGDLAVALTHCLSQTDSQFRGRNPPFAKRPEWRAKAVNLMGLLIRSGAVAAISQAPLAGYSVEIAKSLLFGAVNERENAAAEVLPVIDQVQSAMVELVEEIRSSRLSPGNSGRIVVIIDDLDRCSPEHLVSMLEWLKVHLSVDGISYVLALDHVAAARAIVGRYRTYLGDTRDLSYGYRYLEKLVDVEFELGGSDAVEVMAAAKVFGSEFKRVSEGVQGRLGIEAVSMTEAAELLRFPGLRSPRTALKVVDRFERCLALVSHDKSWGQASSMPASWTVWLFVLCAMYYRLSAEEMTEFVRGEGPFVLAWDGAIGSSLSDASREFIAFAAGWRNRSGGQAARLGPGQMDILATIVRQLVLPPRQ